MEGPNEAEAADPVPRPMSEEEKAVKETFIKAASEFTALKRELWKYISDAVDGNASLRRWQPQAVFSYLQHKMARFNDDEETFKTKRQGLVREQ